MRWELPDGTSLRARSYEDAVRKMAEQKQSKPRTLKRYRMAAARRIKDMYEVIVRTDTNKHFIQDLEGNRLIRRMP